MTKNEILALLNVKFKEAKEISTQNHGPIPDAWSSYYSGIARGLEDAKSIFGMLDKPNNHKTKKTEETEENFLRMC